MLEKELQISATGHNHITPKRINIKTRDTFFTIWS